MIKNIKKTLKVDVLKDIDKLYELIVKKYNNGTIGQGKTCMQIKNNFVKRINEQINFIYNLIKVHNKLAIFKENPQIQNTYIQNMFDMKQAHSRFYKFKIALKNKKTHELYIMDDTEVIDGDNVSLVIYMKYSGREKVQKYSSRLFKILQFDIKNNKLEKKDKPKIDSIKLLY